MEMVTKEIDHREFWHNQRWELGKENRVLKVLILCRRGRAQNLVEDTFQQL